MVETNNIKIDRTGPFSDYVDSGSPFVGFEANNTIILKDNDAHTSAARANLSIARTNSGSTQFGPPAADIGAMVSAAKTNWLTSTVEGEIDVLYNVGRQGFLGDLGGVLVDNKKMRGDPLDNGGAVAVETASTWVNKSTLAEYCRIQNVVGYLEGLGGASGGTGYGFWTEAQAGEPYSAFHANNSSPGGFKNFLTFSADRSDAASIFKITGTGCLRSSTGDPTAPGWSFIRDSDTGVTNPSSNAMGFVTGGTHRWYLDAVGALYPATGNAYPFGTYGFAPSAIYSHTYVTVPSDRRLKMNIEASPLGLDFICRLRPVSFQYRVGGREVVLEDYEVEREEPVTEEGVGRTKVRELVGEAVVEREIVVSARSPVTRPVPVVNEDGAPVLDPRTKEPVVVAIPVTETVKMKGQRQVEREREGRRRHYGLIAQDVKEALDGAGVGDFSGYVLADPADPESMQSLRYEAFIPVLIAAVQDLARQLRELKEVGRR